MEVVQKSDKKHRQKLFDSEILAFCTEPRSLTEVARRFGAADTTTVVRLDSLVVRGLLMKHQDPHSKRKFFTSTQGAWGEEGMPSAHDPFNLIRLNREAK